MDVDDANQIPGFSRQRPPQDSAEIIEISSDEENGAGQSNSTYATNDFVDMQIKQENLSPYRTDKYQMNVSNDSIRAKFLPPISKMEQSSERNVATEQNKSNDSISLEPVQKTATVTSQSQLLVPMVQYDFNTEMKTYDAPIEDGDEYTAKCRNGIQLIANTIEDGAPNVEASYSTPYEYNESNEFDQTPLNTDVDTLTSPQAQLTSGAQNDSNQILLLAKEMATKMAKEMASEMIQDWKNRHRGKGKGKGRSKGKGKRKFEMEFEGFDRNYFLAKKQTKKENGNLVDIPKNTNPYNFMSNKICVICHKQYKRTVYHYKTSHEYAEVFVSRISPRMAEAAKNGYHPSESYVKSSLKYLKAMCLFCETEKDFSFYYWTNHIRSHTGEYANECCICNKIVCFHSHCGHTTTKKDDFDLRVNNLYGYMCLECNYVQINEHNIHQHLLNEHEFEDYHARYDTIVLLPSCTEIKAFMPQNKSSRCTTTEPKTLKASTTVQNIIGDQIVVPLNETIKVDEDEKQNFLGVFNRYNCANSEGGSILQPWIDGDLRKSLNIISQFALFKCMHRECYFATDSEEKWTAHMVWHLKFIEFLNQKNWLTNENRKMHIEFRACPYCITDLKANYQVSTHIESEHRQSIFQCKLCYFRSIEIDGIVIHYDIFHPNEPKEVLLCGDKREIEGDIEDLLWECEQQYFKQFKCGNCDQQFFYYDTFYEHLKESHSQVYFCDEIHCKRLMECNGDVVQTHLKQHKYMEFQCLYCNDSSNEIVHIRSHMAIRHPSKVMFVATRRSKPRLVYIGDSCDHSNFKFFKIDDPELLNELDPKLTTERQQNDSSIESKIKEGFLERIPWISYSSMPEESFITYHDYHRQNSASDLYTCISVTAANEIKRVINMPIDTNVKCDCSQIFEITDSNGAIAPYINHLDEHKCLAADNEKTLIEHRLRKHPGDQIVYLKNGSQLVRCTFQCKMCAKHFETKSQLSNHYTTKHVDSIYAIGIVHDIVSIVSVQRKMALARSEYDRFNLVHLFRCEPCQEYMVTKSEAITHHYKKHAHSNHHLEIHLKMMLIENDVEKLPCMIAESKDPQRMYLFECNHCSMLFDSIVRVQDHINHFHPTLDNKFIARKLVACPICKIVSTYSGLEHHFLKSHENKTFCAVNAIDTKSCGSCSLIFKDIDHLSTHYRESHITNETFSDSLLHRMEVSYSNDFNFGTCVFVPGCCAQLKFNRTKEFIQHILVECKRDFKCDECIKIFPELKTLIEHCRIAHKQTPEEIIESIQNIKKLLNGPLLVMEIIFPNGLTVSRSKIKNTEFDLLLKAHFIKYIKNDFWPIEAGQVHEQFKI